MVHSLQSDKFVPDLVEVELVQSVDFTSLVRGVQIIHDAFSSGGDGITILDV